MHWYLAKIVYRIVCGEGSHKPQFDEQLRLIRASSQRDAFDRAQATGFKHETSFLNAKQEIVTWLFINVAELQELPDLTDGMEIHSQLSESDQAPTFIEMIHKKAEQIQFAVEDVSTQFI